MSGTESSTNHFQATLPAAGDGVGHLSSHVAKSGFVDSLCFAGRRRLYSGGGFTARESNLTP